MRQATDARDMIYGVMSIAKHRSLMSGQFFSYAIPIDYTLSVRDVYLLAFKACMQDNSGGDYLSTTVLSMAEYLTPNNNKDEWKHRHRLGRGQYWPSWLPNWSNPPQRFPIQHFISREANFGFGGVEVFLNHEIDLPVPHGPCLRVRGLVALKIWRVVYYFPYVYHARYFFQHVDLLNELPEHYPMTLLPYGQVYLKILDPRSKDPDSFCIAPSDRVSTFWNAQNSVHTVATEPDDMGNQTKDPKNMNKYTFEDMRAITKKIEWMSCRSSVRKNRMVCGRKIFASTTGFMGLVPSEAEEGDEIAIIPCFAVPYVVRRVDNHFLLIGSCYVLGLMDGEALEDIDASNMKDMYFL